MDKDDRIRELEQTVKDKDIIISELELKLQDIDEQIDEGELSDDELYANSIYNKSVRSL